LDTATLFDCLLAAIEDRNQTELKLKGIAFDERSIQRIDAMAEGKAFRYCGWSSIDPLQSDSPGSPPLAGSPDYVATPHARLLRPRNVARQR
jgi:hypothetical protein